MKISRGFALSCLMALAAGPVFAAGFSLGDAANAISGMQGGNNKAAAAAPSSETAGLLSALTSQLNITPEQAVGGTGAMLGLAKNKLSGTDYSQLGKSMPGLDQLSGSNSLGSLGALSGMLGQSGGSKTSGLDGLLGNVKNTNDLNAVFRSLVFFTLPSRPSKPLVLLPPLWPSSPLKAPRLPRELLPES